MHGFAIGPHQLENGLILAPMAGITDRPFRHLCRHLGAGLAVAEMLTSDTSLWHTQKSQRRLPHADDSLPISVQIAGSEPAQMAHAAQANVALGAQIIDINMGCPAKKVLKKAAGSALLRDPNLVKDILTAVVSAVDVPVTLKIRTGWSTDQRNGLDIANIAQDAGIQALAVHGRTRACGFKGEVEYDTIAAIKQALNIPVIANGDINTAEDAAHVLCYTGADGIMIGRGAQGNPWLFQQVHHYLKHGTPLEKPSNAKVWQILEQHLYGLYSLYGEVMGPRIARKHVGWYLKQEPTQRKLFNQLQTQLQQLEFLNHYFDSAEEQAA
ncbi:MAG: tRNA dihydrouridine synthase DusB [Pseudomonadales bacterium]|uniref:tRNA dihydrouridine synthase DusB n=1 Tax=Candidatus Njordibacter sp. Uisw_056 TaxID=3230973 RepID=UPI00403FE3EC